jgi:glycosyltransferase involved in cell wall biosynthesis
VAYVKRKANAHFYLILRDIHPQSMASIGLIKWPFMYGFLARKAARGYELADRIGCMSQGNIDFVARDYPGLDRSKLVLLMNWQREEGDCTGARRNVREAHGLQDKFIVLFGGNIGVGQRIENIIKLARHYRDNLRIAFLVIGKGVKKAELERMAKEEQLHNIVFMGFMPREEYHEFVRSVDLGLISINENYAVPTCPSKLVSYMSMKVPVFAMINPGNDYGSLIEAAGAGYWAVGSEDERVFALFDKLYADKALRTAMGESGFRYYRKHLTSERAYSNMMEQLNGCGRMAGPECRR